MIGAAALLLAAMPRIAAEDRAIPWDMELLAAPPRVFDDASRSTDAVKAVFYQSLPWKGRPTRTFAYYGIPRTDGATTVPAMVLVHGGGGSAFAPWVELWVGRGYAAIAMDTCGCVSSGGYQHHPRHEHGGPPGWGGFDQVDSPVTDQWVYHAVADVILAHSLIRSFREVDPERTGLTGISWGGYLACIAAAVDHRFKLAAPVYGCGFLGDNSVWLDTFRTMAPDRAQRWLALWDPSVYLADTRTPMLWVSGTNDFAYPMDSLQKSYRLPRSPRTLCLRVGMPHGHGGPGENPEEIHAMADALLNGGTALPGITRRGRTGPDAWIEFESPEPVVNAELNWSADTGPWQERKWSTLAAEVDPARRRVSARLPETTTVFFFNLLARRNLVVSSEHEELAPAPPHAPN